MGTVGEARTRYPGLREVAGAPGRGRRVGPRPPPRDGVRKAGGLPFEEVTHGDAREAGGTTGKVGEGVARQVPFRVCVPPPGPRTKAQCSVADRPA